MTSRLVAFALLVASIAGSAEANVRVEVAFDLDPLGNPVDTSQPIDAVYAPLGIHLAATGALGCPNPPGVYANPDQPVGFGSSPNVVSLCKSPVSSDINENVAGLIEVTLDQAATGVCIDVDVADPADFAVLRAYDDGGGLLSEVFSPPGSQTTLCTLVDGIRRVEFSGAGDHWARFDNLVIQYGDVQSINFEVDTSGLPVAPGTTINNLYSPWGVTFAAVGDGESCGPDIYASDNHPGDFGTPGNLVSSCEPPIASDISEETYKIVEASFDPPACAVCVNVRPDDPSDRAFLRAYNQNGDLIEEALSTAGVIQTLCVSGLITHSVQFSGFQDKFSRFDDLFYISVTGTIGIPDQTTTPSKLRVENVLPNPSRGQARVTYSAEPGKPLMLQVVDVSGRTVISRWLAGANGSSQRVEIGTGERLPSGVYWIRMTQARETISRKWVVLE